MNVRNPSLADLLGEHVTLEVESLDRLYLNAYVPQLQRDMGLVGFLRYHLGHLIASTALLEPLTQRFVEAIHRFVDAHGIDLVSFEKGQRKDEVARADLSRFRGEEGTDRVNRNETPLVRFY